MELGRPSSARRSSMSQINVTPFVDVMLVLLIIFMVTAPMLDQGVEVDLPEVAEAPGLPVQQ
ncbi:MAG: biopolymer transporter ExbD, partial [Desulfuromonadales bacterium]|nr:biopolymer transporter ExbD [Desulfuromonadales bacterium]